MEIINFKFKKKKINIQKIKANFWYPIESYFDEYYKEQWKFNCYDGYNDSGSFYKTNIKKKIIDDKELLNINDWKNIYLCQFGEKDGNDWIIVYKHKNGYYVYFRAGCDYTGFNCQGYININYTKNSTTFWNFCMDAYCRFQLLHINGYKFNIKFDK
jgi:hypothetical protein